MKSICFFWIVFFHGLIFCQINSNYTQQSLQSNIQFEQLNIEKQKLINKYDSISEVDLGILRVSKSELQDLKKSKNVVKDMITEYNIDENKVKLYELLQKERIINPESKKYSAYFLYLKKTFISASEILLITSDGFYCGFTDDSLGQIMDCSKVNYSKEQQKKLNKLWLNEKLAFVQSNQIIIEQFTGVTTGYMYLKEELEKIENNIISKVSQLNRMEVSIQEQCKLFEEKLKKIEYDIELISHPQITTTSTTTQGTNYFGSGVSGNGSGNGPFGGSGNGSGDGYGIGRGSGKGRVRLNNVSLPSYESDFDCRIGFRVQVNENGQVVSVRTIKSVTTCIDEKIINDIEERIKRGVRYNKEPGTGIVEMDYTISLKKGYHINSVSHNTDFHDLKEIPKYDIDNTCNIHFDLKVDSSGSIIQITVNNEKTTCKGESIIADLSERIQNEVKFQKNPNTTLRDEIYFITLWGNDIK